MASNTEIATALSAAEKQSLARCEKVIERGLGTFREVGMALMEIRETIALENAVTGRPVVVVPILIAGGAIAARTVPHDLEGLDVVYGGGPLVPDPQIAHWVERRVRDAVAR